jgi:hypothetical protein
MFNPHAKINSPAAHERLLRIRATEEAASLFRRLGGEAAIRLASADLLDQSKTAEERRHNRLMIVELERLDRIERYGPPSQAPVVWKPPLFSMARLRSFLRTKRHGGLS